jgi:hypothetical protein
LISGSTGFRYNEKVDNDEKLIEGKLRLAGNQKETAIYKRATGERKKVADLFYLVRREFTVKIK